MTTDEIRWQSSRTSSLAEAQRSMTDLYSAPMDLAATPDRSFAYAMSAAIDDTVSVASLRFEGRCRSGTEAFSDLMIAHAVRGSHRWRVGDERGNGSVPFIVPPDVEMRVEFTSAHIRTVGLDTAYVRRVAESLNGMPDAPFRLNGINTHRRHPALVGEAVASLEAMMRSDSALRDAALVRAQMRRHAVVSILSSYPLVDLDRRPDRGIQSRRVRLAVAFMEAHAHEPITVGDVAIASATTTRSLQSAFRRAYDMTPMQYLRRLRLRLAREELLASTDPRLSVRDVAFRWGFAHPGRFAQQYAATFSEHPSTTLRR
ncbi:helix-turn-helix domain-containing protein [Microbacterium sp. SSM24]|uniref:helix-turn-helix domain-containing protein n=1 Tax=Microbacterium sp. SSM24 TaxID=2991714 RepID=UPI0022266EAB|nr:helix-turn-helix domain-containing protein [Microbacterium sp. SSM24]MCW3491761.1 helix-turn-helix domain-containing protein [Microbacterium sp. SSM24]